MLTEEYYIEQTTFKESDFCGKNILPHSVFKAFENVATKHSVLLGVGYADIIKNNLLWVAMRIKYQIVDKIMPNQQVFVKTFSQAKNMLEFDRDFIIEDISGKILIKGTSKWCLINSKTRRVEKMHNVQLPVANIKPVFEQKFFKTETFEPTFAPDFSYKVIDEDIDVNGHMNNAVYAQIVYDSLVEAKDAFIEIFQLNFLREAVRGDRIDVYKKNTDDEILVIGKRCERENSFSAYLKLKH